MLQIRVPQLGDDHPLFSDLMDHHIVHKASVHYHMSNGGQGKLREKGLPVPLHTLGGKAKLLRSLNQTVGIGALLSVPAICRIFVMDVDRPYCLETAARQAAPQSVISCCFMQ